MPAFKSRKMLKMVLEQHGPAVENYFIYAVIFGGEKCPVGGVPWQAKQEVIEKILVYEREELKVMIHSSLYALSSFSGHNIAPKDYSYRHGCFLCFCGARG
jgi:hypothetical protein